MCRWNININIFCLKDNFIINYLFYLKKLFIYLKSCYNYNDNNMGYYRVKLMYDKKADNKIIDKKEKSKELDNKIEEKRKIINQINDVEEGISALNNSINKCIELLSYSMDGNDVKKVLSISSDVNISNTKKIMSAIDERRNNLDKEIKKIDKEKESVKSQKEE